MSEEPQALRPEGRSLRILTVCTHNRTRSVMMAAMLDSRLRERLGIDGAALSSAGFGPPGIPAIEDAVEAMERRGLDVSNHRSRQMTTGVLDGVDVVLTAEREHVVKIAALSPAMFQIAMTLPEFLQLAAADPVRSSTDPSRWIKGLTANRTAGQYLRGDIGEIADPTGSSPRVFEAAVVVLEQQCDEAAGFLARPATG